MPNKYVDFVSDAHFEKCVRHVCKEFENTGQIDDKKLQSNGIDPIKMTFDMIKHGISFDVWKKKEAERQDDKSVNNTIGEFHQMLLGGVSGWTDLGIGDESKLDLQKNDGSVFLELKNKENTVNDDSLRQVRGKLETAANTHTTAMCYWAYVVAKNGKSEDRDWEYKKVNNPRIRRLTGAKIYELITCDEKNLKRVWEKLPLAIKNVCGTNFTISSGDNMIFNDWFNNAFYKPKKSRKKKNQ